MTIAVLAISGGAALRASLIKASLSSAADAAVTPTATRIAVESSNVCLMVVSPVCVRESILIKPKRRFLRLPRAWQHQNLVQFGRRFLRPPVKSPNYGLG